MTTVRLWLHQTRFEILQYWRSPANAIFSLAMPIALLVILGAVRVNVPFASGSPLTYDQYLVPALLAFALIGATFTNLAMTLTIRRESGVLRRLRGTPLPPAAFLLALITNAVLVTAVLVLIMSGVGLLLFHLPFPAHPFAALLIAVIAMASFAALGVALSALIPSGESAPGITNALLLPLSIASGVFFPIPASSGISHVMIFLPIRPLVEEFACTFLAAAPQAPAYAPLVIAGWGIVGLVVAVTRFRWSPST